MQHIVVQHSTAHPSLWGLSADSITILTTYSSGQCGCHDTRKRSEDSELHDLYSQDILKTTFKRVTRQKRRLRRLKKMIINSIVEIDRDERSSVV